MGHYDAGLLPFTHLLFVEFEDFLAMRVQLLGEIAYELVTLFFRLKKSTFQPPINIPSGLPRSLAFGLIMWNDAHSRLRHSSCGRSIFVRYGWHDLKVAFSLFLCSDSEVVLEEYLLIAMADQQRSFPGIAVESDMVGDEAVAKAVFWRTFWFPLYAGLTVFFTLAIFIGNIVGFDKQSCPFECFTAAVHELSVGESEG